MFIEDLKNDFYNVLLGKRVLLIVHCDVDAVCACKILLDLFKCDNIAYTLVPVGTIQELKHAYEENKEEVKFVVLINCGGTIDLVDVLQPDEDVVFFVLDAHKPTDVCNVYSDGQVRLVYRDGEENIPNFDDIFRDDEDEEEEDADSLEALTEKRRARREWELKRDTLMFNYTQFSYLGKPSGAVACSLSSMLGRLGAAWAGGVAAAARRDDQPELLNDILAQHRHDTAQAERVVLEKDVCLPLYRMWTLEDAIKHCPMLGPQLKVHTLAGEQKVKQLLTEMGYPLAQARQQFRSMCVTLRHGVVEALSQAAGSARGVTRLVCVLRRNTAPDMSAVDVALMLQALLEQESWEDRCEGFKDSLSVLNPGPAGDEARAKALRRAITLLKAARECASVPPVVTAAATLFTVPHTSGIPGPTWLAVAAMWVRRLGKPTIAILEGPATSLVYGLPPSGETHTNNLFGAALSQAAAQSGVEMSRQHVSACVVSVHNSARTHLLQALSQLLT